MNEASKRFNLVLPVGLKERLGIHAERSGLTQAAVMKTALDEYLRQHGV